MIPYGSFQETLAAFGALVALIIGEDHGLPFCGIFSSVLGNDKMTTSLLPLSLQDGGIVSFKTFQIGV